MTKSIIKFSKSIDIMGELDIRKDIDKKIQE